MDLESRSRESEQSQVTRVFDDPTLCEVFCCEYRNIHDLLTSKAARFPCSKEVIADHRIA